MIYAILAISIFGAFPGAIQWNGLSLAALLMGVLVVYAVCVVALKPVLNRRYLIVILLLACFVMFDLVARSWAPIDLKNIYDTIVWIGVFAILIATSRPGLYSDVVLADLNKALSSLGVPFVSFILLLGAIGSHDPASTQVGFLFFAYYLVRYVNGDSSAAVVVFLIITAHILTLNRTIFATEIFLFLFSDAFLHANGARKTAGRRIIKWMAKIALLGLVIAVALSTNFLAAFTEGDNAMAIGSVNINTAGRAAQWMLVYESGVESFWFGSGYDVPNEFRLIDGWAHPHNDYLRLFHRLGVVGLVLWVLFYWVLILALRKKITYELSKLERQWIQMALVYSIGVSVFMITDNTLVYSYVMFPFAALAGVALSCGRPSGRQISGSGC